PIAFAGFHRGMLSFGKAPITMTMTENRVTFSGPESSVEMDVLKGLGGKAGEGDEPAQRRFSGLHAVQVRDTQARERQSDVELLGHEWIHVDDGCREQAVTVRLKQAITIVPDTRLRFDCAGAARVRQTTRGDSGRRGTR